MLQQSNVELKEGNQTLKLAVRRHAQLQDDGMDVDLEDGGSYGLSQRTQRKYGSFFFRFKRILQSLRRQQLCELRRHHLQFDRLQLYHQRHLWILCPCLLGFCCHEQL